MRRSLFLAALAIAFAVPAFAQQPESIPRAVERLEAELAALASQLQALEEAGTGATAGPAGERGPAGPAGPAGPRGERGPAGSTGERGPAGPAGPRGERGPAGPAGSTGEPAAAVDFESLREDIARLAGELRALKVAGAAAGPAGPRGLRGPAGAAGPQGPAGARGERGLRGPAGPAGAQGERGPRGSTGPSGASASLNNLDKFGLRNNRVYLGSNEEGGYIIINDIEGDRRITASIGGSNNILSSRMNFYNNDDKLVVFIGQWGNSEAGGAVFFDASGERKVEVGVRESGNGYILVNGRNVNDYAEIFELATREGMRAGAAVAWNPEAGGIEPATRENARLAVGAVAGAGGLRSGMVIGSRADGTEDFPVALAGVVYALVSAEAGPVAPGDLLTPSSAPGVGMRAGEDAAAGAVYGKALGAWAGEGEGLVLMLVMNR